MNVKHWLERIKIGELADHLISLSCAVNGYREYEESHVRVVEAIMGCSPPDCIPATFSTETRP